MKKVRKPSRGRVVSTRSAKRKRAGASKMARKPKAATRSPKRKPVQAKPRAKRAPAAAKGPSVASLQRRTQTLEGQLRSREQDRVELARWKAYHAQLQEQVKAKDAALSFKEKELMDLRRHLEAAKVEKKPTSA